MSGEDGGNRWRHNVIKADQHVEIQLAGMLPLGRAASNPEMITIKMVEIVGSSESLSLVINP